MDSLGQLNQNQQPVPSLYLTLYNTLLVIPQAIGSFVFFAWFVFGRIMLMMGASSDSPAFIVPVLLSLAVTQFVIILVWTGNKAILSKLFHLDGNQPNVFITLVSLALYVFGLGYIIFSIFSLITE